MFELTYLGHHGFLITAADTRVLVDPLFGPGLGNMPQDAVLVYPPRRFDFERFPAVDALVITHEHPDHLSLPSLRVLDPRIPVFLSGRASRAAFEILTELGHPVTRLVSGQAVRVGALELLPYHSRQNTRDEWDVMPFCIRDRDGHGSFVTSIDAPESLDFARFVRARAGRPGVWVFAHGHLDLFVDFEGARPETEPALTERIQHGMLERANAQFANGERPELLLVLGCHFAFRNELDWLNRHCFGGDSERIAAGLARELRGQRTKAPHPGYSARFERGTLTGEAEATSFLSCVEREAWPEHCGLCDVPAPVEDYFPAGGRSELTPDEEAALPEALAGFAEFLYGGPLFAELLSVGAADFAPRRATFAFSLRVEGRAPLVFAYDLTGCRFERVDSAAARDQFVAGLECWAADLLAVLRIELIAGYVLLGRLRCWNHASERLRLDLVDALSLYTHPLRHPVRHIELYRRTWRALGGRGTSLVRFHERSAQDGE
ncbi:MAG TPA: MBL fold metallo-hydrolase [Polyangiaceae bacterium]